MAVLKKEHWIPALIGVGTALVLISFFLPFSSQKTSKNQVPIAQAWRETGQVFRIKQGSIEKLKIDKRTEIQDQDTLETDDIGETIIAFPSGFQIRVFNNSLLTLEKLDDEKGFYVVVILKRGELRIEQFGEEGRLYISKNGDRVSATDYNESLLARAQTTPDQTNDQILSSSSKLSQELNAGLSQQEIAQAVQKYRTSFFKCYTQLLQKEATAKGQVNLSFTIQPEGKLTQPQIVYSEIKNSDFKKCLLDVTGRIEFRQFQGNAISTLFPLKFE